MASNFGGQTGGFGGQAGRFGGQAGGFGGQAGGFSGQAGGFGGQAGRFGGQTDDNQAGGNDSPMGGGDRMSGGGNPFGGKPFEYDPLGGTGGDSDQDNSEQDQPMMNGDSDQDNSEQDQPMMNGDSDGDDSISNDENPFSETSSEYLENALEQISNFKEIFSQFADEAEGVGESFAPVEEFLDTLFNTESNSGDDTSAEGESVFPNLSSDFLELNQEQISNYQEIFSQLGDQVDGGEGDDLAPISADTGSESGDDTFIDEAITEAGSVFSELSSNNLKLAQEQYPEFADIISQFSDSANAFASGSISPSEFSTLFETDISSLSDSIDKLIDTNLLAVDNNTTA